MLKEILINDEIDILFGNKIRESHTKTLQIHNIHHKRFTSNTNCYIWCHFKHPFNLILNM